ncbi:unnamed protein product [Gongylonema pulchrum]|uniref:USP domain-containing protein n=1 Tax=Gongylonema pulchrum TaxID=637853 RepID=A0A183EJK1_9BILA|nr:unnamed protein product [Gongylonema pulchrum]
MAKVLNVGYFKTCGHYVAYCKNEVDDNWYEYDDSVVTRVEVADILTKEAYVLFYQKRPTEDMADIMNRVRQLLVRDFVENNKVSPTEG